MMPMRLFENDVKMYGTQTILHQYHPGYWFENDVKMYGTQTEVPFLLYIVEFENDVKMYGTQTHKAWFYSTLGLRMM